MLRCIAKLCASLVVMATCASALAQDYPNKPVKLLVPFAAGGPADVYARFLAQRLQDAMGQPFVVENRPGGGAVLGTEIAAKSAPDGYTLLVMSNTHTVNESLLPNRPYQLMRDFTPVAPINYSDLVLVVHPSVGVDSVADLVKLAKASPGKLNYASSGPGTPYHMAGELFKAMAGVDLLHVPYKGTALSIPDLANGRVSILFDNIVSAQPHLRAGTVKALAVTSKARSALMPELPTMSEAGVAGFDSTAWFALFGPAGLPAEIRARLHEAAVAAVKAPDARERLAAAGAEISGAGGDELASLMRGDIAKWGRVVKTGNIKAE